MKGKGKKGRDSSEDECPLQFLDFEPLDVLRFCPRFTQIGNRSEEEGIGIEDLDPLQSEIESMLVNVTRRSIAIESEINALVNWQESQIKPKKGSPNKSSDATATASSSSSPLKRKNNRNRETNDEEKTSSKSKRIKSSDTSSLIISKVSTAGVGDNSSSSSSCSSSSSSSSSSASSVSSVSTADASSSARASLSSSVPSSPVTELTTSASTPSKGHHHHHHHNHTASSSTTSSTSKESKVKSKSKNLTNKATTTTATTQQSPYDSESYHSKNDLPDRFCTFIEQFTAPVKQDDVKFLEDLIKSYEDDSMNEFYKIPNRGKHYATKWGASNSTADTSATVTTTKSGKERKKASSNAAAATTTTTTSSSSSPSSATAAATVTKGGKKNQNKDSAGSNKSENEKGNYGILTQRLIQSLLEDSSGGASPESSPLASADVSAETAANGSNSINGTAMTGTNNGHLWKQVSAGNTAQIEKRIRKELQYHGLIELDEPEVPVNSSSTTGSSGGGTAAAADDDEILRELIKCQSELKMIASTNASQLKSLLSLVKVDQERQEIEKQLSLVDEEVIDGYKRLMQSKSKKRNFTKKEKDSCFKSLREREELVKQLDALITHHHHDAADDNHGDHHKTTQVT